MFIDTLENLNVSEYVLFCHSCHDSNNSRRRRRARNRSNSGGVSRCEILEDDNSNNSESILLEDSQIFYPIQPTSNLPAVDFENHFDGFDFETDNSIDVDSSSSSERISSMERNSFTDDPSSSISTTSSIDENNDISRSFQSGSNTSLDSFYPFNNITHFNRFQQCVVRDQQSSIPNFIQDIFDENFLRDFPDERPDSFRYSKKFIYKDLKRKARFPTTLSCSSRSYAACGRVFSFLLNESL